MTAAEKAEIISRNLDRLVEAAGLANKIHTHTQRWRVDGVKNIEATRVHRTRQDLRGFIGATNQYNVEWTLQCRALLLKQLSKAAYQQHYKYGCRLRPAKRPVPLP